jgi:ribonuclease HI
MRLYTDASFDADNHMAGAGLVVTDHTGVPVAVQEQTIGRIETIQHAEADAITRGLDKLYDTSVNHLIVHTDNANGAARVSWDEYTQYFHTLKSTCIASKDNAVADTLARLALNEAEY